MVRSRSVSPLARPRYCARCARDRAGRAAARVMIVGIVVVIAGCAIVPREHMDECQRIAQTLRSENARLKDRVLALQGQNRDYAERAVDDSRRLAVQDEAIDRLERSVHAYQDERNRLEAAYQQLASSLDSTGQRPGARVSVGRSEMRPAKKSDGDATRTSRRSRSNGSAADEERQ